MATSTRTWLFILVALPLLAAFSSCCVIPFILSVLTETSRNGAAPEPTATSSESVAAETDAKSDEQIVQYDTLAMVRVKIYDDTKGKPIHNRAAIQFRGSDLWWFKVPAEKAAKELNIAGANITLGPRPVGKKNDGDDAIALYPDGYESGPRITIPFTMTAEMPPKGSDLGTVVIAIKDDEVDVFGAPLEAATGNTSLLLKRSTGELLAAKKSRTSEEIDAEIATIFGKGSKTKAAPTTTVDKVGARTMAEAPKDTHTTMPNRRPSIGDSGRLNGGAFRVVQVLDPDNCLAELFWYESILLDAGDQNANQARIRSAIQGDSTGLSKEIVWLQIPTSNLIDGRLYSTEAIFEAVGPKHYQSAFGQRTVMEVRRTPDE